MNNVKVDTLLFEMGCDLKSSGKHAILPFNALRTFGCISKMHTKSMLFTKKRIDMQ